MIASADFSRQQKASLGLGLGLLALGTICGFFFPANFFAGYLTAFVFWVEFAVGCLALLLIQYLTGGRWGAAITRLLEAGMMTLPLCAALFLPIFLGLPLLFPWIDPQGVELQHLVHDKAPYLNVPFYVVRYLIYFTVLCAMAGWLRRLSLRRELGDAVALATLRQWSGPCLIVVVLLMNFACVDWVMALNPEWHSSMLVVEFMAEQGVAVMAGCIIVLRCLSHLEPVRVVLSVKVVHDLGNLLLGFICFWTYVTFMEYIITWTGNLPHEVAWFSDRSSALWKIFAAVLVLVHFAVPVSFLIFTYVSKNLVRLARVAGVMIVAHFLQVVWWIEPAFGPHAHFSWMSLPLIPALGGIWLFEFLRNLRRAPLMPKELASAVVGEAIA